MFELFDFQKDIIKELQMGVNYTQNCILGFCIDADEVKEILAPAEYDEQPRYNPRTGEQTHTERVLVRQEQIVYKWGGLENEFFYELAEDISNKYDLDFVYDDSTATLFLGEMIGERTDCGRVDLLEDSISLATLQQLADDLKKRLPEYQDKIELHFVCHVG
jgi:hypothetical protein